MTEQRKHQFHCPHCDQEIVAGIISDEDRQTSEEFHMEECRLGPVHRTVTFEVSKRRHGDASCGDESEQRRSTMPSSVTCERCIEVTPGLQLLGMLETVVQQGNLERVDAPEPVKEALRVIRLELERESSQ